jgi:DNA-binding PadR family transcriptional regulator
VLQRLLREGWAVAEWGVSARNRRVRIYRITPAGKKQLEKDVSKLEDMVRGIFSVLRSQES